MTVLKGRGITHVERDSDDVEAHGGVCDTAEGRGLERQQVDTAMHQKVILP